MLVDLLEQGVMAGHPIWKPSEDRARPEKVLSTMMTQTEWQSHPLYCEVLRADNVRDHLTIDFGAATGNFVMIGILRSIPRFHERDREVMRLLMPHFTQAFANARIVDFHGLQIHESTDTGYYVHSVDYLARLVSIESDRAKRWRRFFGPNLTEEEMKIKQWVKATVTQFNSGYLNPTQPSLKIRTDNCFVAISMERASGGLGYRLLEKVQRFGDERHALSQRETEVLHWVREGKTNHEIAIILGLSLYTVKDHLKSIYRKLGVDNRTSAVRWHKAP